LTIPIAQLAEVVRSLMAFFFCMAGRLLRPDLRRILKWRQLSLAHPHDHSRLK
jgi:hypothetical protein